MKRMALALTAVLVVACNSPEATRTRGGGPGGDVGNRWRFVQMHEGSRQFPGTPRLLADRLGAPIEPAAQADRLSRQGRGASAR
jgi:hypothetical protein